MTTVLIVDDDPHILRSLKIGLLTNGYNTLEASDGPTALALLSERRTGIDIVVTDYLMPETSGIELLLAARERGNTTPVILMTAYADKKLAIQALQYECEGFLEKPFTVKELLAEIERIQKAQTRKQQIRNISSLLPRIAHQINNPLQTITGNAQLSMLQIEDQSALKKNLASILLATSMISSINKEIMQLGSHITSRKHQRFNLVDVLDTVIAEFSGVLSVNEVTLNKSLPEETVNIVGDQNRLKDVFRNLLINGLEAMVERPEKVMSIDLVVSNTPNKALLSFTDSGCGDPKNRLKKIIKPYTTYKYHGTGLGLAIARETQIDHGGTIMVTSTPGHGTCFLLTLPLSTT